MTKGAFGSRMSGTNFSWMEPRDSGMLIRGNAGREAEGATGGADQATVSQAKRMATSREVNRMPVTVFLKEQTVRLKDFVKTRSGAVKKMRLRDVSCFTVI